MYLNSMKYYHTSLFKLKFKSSSSCVTLKKSGDESLLPVIFRFLGLVNSQDLSLEYCAILNKILDLFKIDLAQTIEQGILNIWYIAL